MVITDRDMAGPDAWLTTVETALAAGATAVQLRDKAATSGELLQMARAMRSIAARYGVLFIVNDRLDVALAAGADGVHVGDDDLPVAEIRRVTGRGFVIGRSADTVEDARRAEAAGADYLGVGSVFGTRTKPELAGEVIGVGRLTEVVAAVSIPCVGIGGVTTENADAVSRAGAAGVAVISAVMASDDPALAVRRLLAGLADGAKQP